MWVWGRVVDCLHFVVLKAVLRELVTYASRSRRNSTGNINLHIHDQTFIWIITHATMELHYIEQKELLLLSIPRICTHIMSYIKAIYFLEGKFIRKPKEKNF